MSRALRVEYPGAHYHVMCRGNNGQEVFLADKGRRLFLSTLGEACEQTGWWIHAYVLMSNHYHLLLETPEPNLVAGMTWFQGSYTQRFNAMFKRRGHLYQGRYKAIPVQTDPREGGLEYFRQVSTYIHLNPFRAKLCGEGMPCPLESYKWSSYPAYVGKSSKRPEWLVRGKVLKSCGLEEGESGTMAAYRHRLERAMKFEAEPMKARRGEFKDRIESGWYLGSEEFRERISDLLTGHPKGDNYRGKQRREHNEDMAEQLLRQSLDVLGLSEEELLKLKNAAIEKQALAWLIKTRTSVTGVWICGRLNMGHRSNLSRALSCFRDPEKSEIQTVKRKLIQCTG